MTKPTAMMITLVGPIPLWFGAREALHWHVAAKTTFCSLTFVPFSDVMVLEP